MRNLGSLFYYSRIYPTRCLIGNNTQTVTALAAESMDQTASFFMRKSAGFAAAIAQHRPPLCF